MRVGEASERFGLRKIDWRAAAAAIPVWGRRDRGSRQFKIACASEFWSDRGNNQWGHSLSDCRYSTDGELLGVQPCRPLLSNSPGPHALTCALFTLISPPWRLPASSLLHTLAPCPETLSFFQSQVGILFWSLLVVSERLPSRSIPLYNLPTYIPPFAFHGLQRTQKHSDHARSQTTFPAQTQVATPSRLSLYVVLKQLLTFLWRVRVTATIQIR